MTRALPICIVLGLTILNAIAVTLLLTSPVDPSLATAAKEVELQDDLLTLRSVIDQYTLDKQRLPESLRDLVSAGYLKRIPNDPFTGSPATWKEIQDDTPPIDPMRTEPGMIDVRSGASGSGRDGVPYSSW